MGFDRPLVFSCVFSVLLRCFESGMVSSLGDRGDRKTREIEESREEERVLIDRWFSLASSPYSRVVLNRKWPAAWAIGEIDKRERLESRERWKWRSAQTGRLRADAFNNFAVDVC